MQSKGIMVCLDNGGKRFLWAGRGCFFNHAAQNFSVINRIALNLLKNDTYSKRSVKGKRLKAGWSNEYLQHVLKI
jgi:hypothetical protein